MRTQRSRTKKPGIPLGSVYVGRPSQWGNPAIVGTWHNQEFVSNRLLAVSMFYEFCKEKAAADGAAFGAWLLPLVDRDLCCWCPVTEPCHGDILIHLARYLKPILEKSDFGTLIEQSVKDWPGLSGIIVL